MNEFIKKHNEFFTFTALFVIFYLIFFFGTGSYPLMDIDETRYASMAHDMFRTGDYMTLYLNGEYFFEKPPLYFWFECLSFALFGKVNEFTVRFPVSVMGFLSSFLVYFVGKKVISKEFGIISALILATSAEFFILSKFAILDIVLCFCTTFSVFFGFMTLFCEERRRKYFWWLFYLFSGLAVLAKGIPGFVIPFGTMFFSYIVSKKFKELFKPVFFIPGTIIFLCTVLPWHILMLKTHDPLFFNEYIMKHHLARFTTSAELGRKQPFYFFLLTILGGFFPWTLPAIASCKIWLGKIFGFFKNGFDFENCGNYGKFLILNGIAAVLILLFFSSSSTKLVTYILPIYPFLACLAAPIFLCEKGNEYNKPVRITEIILGSVFLAAGLIVPTVRYLTNVLNKIPSDNFIITFFIVVGLFLIIKKKLSKIVSFVILTIGLSAFGIPYGFNVDYSFGQNDLINYAKLAKFNNLQLASFGFGKRYSLNYYYGKHVIYETLPIYANLKFLLKDKNTVVVIKNKDFKEIKQNADFQIIEKGVKYTLIKGKNHGNESKSYSKRRRFRNVRNRK